MWGRLTARLQPDRSTRDHDRSSFTTTTVGAGRDQVSGVRGRRFPGTANRSTSELATAMRERLQRQSQLANRIREEADTSEDRTAATRLQSRLRDQERATERLRDRVDASDATLVRLREQNRTLTQLREQLRERNRTLAQLREQLQAQDRHRAEIRTQLGEQRRIAGRFGDGGDGDGSGDGDGGDGSGDGGDGDGGGRQVTPGAGTGEPGLAVTGRSSPAVGQSVEPVAPSAVQPATVEEYLTLATLAALLARRR